MRTSQYTRIAGILRERIKRGEYSRRFIESQKELAEIFDTTVMTVRQAIAVLEDEGLIEVVQGVGTFVNSGSVKGFDLKLKGFSDDVERRKSHIATRVVKREFKLRDEKIQRALGLGEESFCRITRLRSLGEEPVIYQKSCLASRYEELALILADGASLYSLVNEKTKGVVEGREVLKPVLLGAEEAAALGEEAGAPAFLSLRISFDIAGAPVIFDEAYLRDGRVLCVLRESGNRRSFNYNVPVGGAVDPIEQLLEPAFWEEP